MKYSPGEASGYGGQCLPHSCEFLLTSFIAERINYFRHASLLPASPWSFLTPRCVPSPFVYARPFPFPQSPRCPYLWSHLCSHQWDEELLALLGSVSIFKGNLAVLVPQGWRKVYLLLQGAPHGEGFLSLEAGACLMVGPPPLFLGFGFPSGFFVF